MAFTATELLDLIDQVIAKRLAGDAVESYTEAQNRFAGTPLRDLFDIRDRLVAQSAASQSGGGIFRLAEPFEA